MRREHVSILTDVLDALASCTDERPGDLHITAVAARANLPHDRLKTYLAELADAGLLWREWPYSPTAKGRQFLECYHAWLRLQVMFGLAQKAPGSHLGAPVRPAGAAPAPIVPGAAKAEAPEPIPLLETM